MLKMVCSGAQTGADLGGLIAAEKFGIKTGGWCPKGCKTEAGTKPELIERFGLWETNTDSYVPRTHANAKMGDGTIRFAFDFDSAGEILTSQSCSRFEKPIIDVDVENPRPVQEVVDWIKEHNIETLNIAGNRESKYPGMEKFVVNYLGQVFTTLGHT
ncbi:MAG: putative molybdenum carrier protein [Proteobacteria bacterium]|jgi:hypothetical protein|nr:putative molybdenum carrier protein [Pseudomonadota bacterium]